jgi:hypothetical protein
MRLTFVLLCLAGCSYTFDSEAPQLPLIGAMPDTPSLPHLNDRPVDYEQFTRGGDGQIWLAMTQTDQSFRFVRMTGPPGGVETIEPLAYDDVLITGRALYLTKRSASGGDGGTDGGTTDGGVSTSAGAMPDGGAPLVTLIIRAVAEQPGQQFLLPPGNAVLFVGGQDSAFVYMVTDGSQPGYLVQQRDRSFTRVVPWPKGVDPANPFGKGHFFWDNGRADVFYDQNADGRLIGHHARDNLDVDLGIRPTYLGWVDSSRLISCGIDGVRIIPVDGTPEHILDNDPCSQSGLFINGDYAYYDVGTVLRKAKVDGSEAPKVVWDHGDKRPLIVETPEDLIIYSTDPDDRYVHGAGDGWIGNWKFMQRGTALSFDRLHLYWLEDSAQNSGAGTLTTVTLPASDQPGGTITPLARNVRGYSFLPDGRILCDANHAFNGTQDRIIAIDTFRHHAQWVASSANHYSGIPRTRDLIVDVVSGASGHDVVRVSVPPVFPPVPPNN